MANQKITKKPKKSKIKILCLNCGKSFKVFPCIAGKRKYCSVKCSSERNKKPLVEMVCLNCGKILKLRPSIAKRHKFCSHKCGSLFKKGQRYSKSTEFKQQILVTKEELIDLYWTQNKNYTEIAQNLNCSIGGLWRIFERYEIPRRPSFGNKNFVYPNGKDHPGWRGGYEPYYGANWQKQRKKALERDKYQCQECGSLTNLNVHHKQPVLTFKIREEANFLDNLVVLCRSCHSKIEWIYRKNGLETTRRSRNNAKI